MYNKKKKKNTLTGRLIYVSVFNHERFGRWKLEENPTAFIRERQKKNREREAAVFVLMRQMDKIEKKYV